MGLLWSDINVKNSATAKEKKATPLNANFKGHIRPTGTEPDSYKFMNTTVGKTMQDYGNFKTQVIRDQYSNGTTRSARRG